jgi:multiple sugar transport system permease protein
MKQPAKSSGSQLAWVGMGLAAPAAFLLVVLYVLPLLCLLLLSFTDYELGATALRWVGVENFQRAWNDPVFIRSLRNTLLYMAIVIPGGVLLSLWVALLVHQRSRSRSFYEVIYFLPVTSTLIAMATVWQFLLHPKLGFINAALRAVGLGETAFITDPVWVIPVLSFIGLWQMIGFNMIIYLAGLAQIPPDMYEAAEVDGVVDGWERFTHITWPLLAPTTVFVVVTTCISAFKVFDTVLALTQGKSQSEVILYAIYLEGFQYFKMGYAAALTLIFLGLIFVASSIQLIKLDKKAHYA